MKLSLTIYLSFLLSVSAFAQLDMLSKTVTLHYDKIRLQEALTEISRQYDIKFSYSSQHVNIRQRVTVHVDDVPLSQGLDQLFSNTRVMYSVVGGHIVLRTNPEKPLTKTGSRESVKKEMPEPVEEPPAVLVKTEDPPRKEIVRPVPDSVISLQMPETQPVRSEGKMHPYDETLLNFEKWRTKATWTFSKKGEKRIAQVSLLPEFGTNAYNSPEVTNNISMNLLWGDNGGVDGVEFGTIMNTVRQDVNGFQAAGFGNKVGRNVTGTQVAGIFNSSQGMTRGFQVAGIINFSNDVQAMQTAGFVNWSNGDVAGMQASGLFNRVAGNSDALQAAGLFNISGGVAKVQISGLFNRASDVEIAQFGGLVNVATGEVKGFQVGLLNISDTVSGVPIGLINIVKRGYNKFEIYTSESLHGNLQLKLGANAFYNIFHIGTQVPPGDGSYAWGLGYGIGTVTTVSEKTTLNWELMAIHINEDEPWTNKLNSIGQFRFLWHHQIGKNIGFFLGPTANVMISQLRNPETGKIHSTVVPYTLINDDLNTRTNLKAWIGVNGGFRF